MGQKESRFGNFLLRCADCPRRILTPFCRGCYAVWRGASHARPHSNRVFSPRPHSNRVFSPLFAGAATPYGEGRRTQHSNRECSPLLQGLLRRMARGVARSTWRGGGGGGEGHRTTTQRVEDKTLTAAPTPLKPCILTPFCRGCYAVCRGASHAALKSRMLTPFAGAATPYGEPEGGRQDPRSRAGRAQTMYSHPFRRGCYAVWRGASHARPHSNRVFSPRPHSNRVFSPLLQGLLRRMARGVARSTWRGGGGGGGGHRTTTQRVEDKTLTAAPTPLKPCILTPFCRGCYAVCRGASHAALKS